MTGRDFDLINSILKKLLNHNLKESKRDIPDIFEALDGGSEIDLTSLEDDYVKAKLSKLFKLLLLKRATENKLEFWKHENLHKDISLKKLIEFMIWNVEKEMSNYSGSENEDANSDEEEICGGKWKWESSSDNDISEK